MVLASEVRILVYQCGVAFACCERIGSTPTFPAAVRLIDPTTVCASDGAAGRFASTFQGVGEDWGPFVIAPALRRAAFELKISTKLLLRRWSPSRYPLFASASGGPIGEEEC